MMERPSDFREPVSDQPSQKVEVKETEYDT